MLDFENMPTLAWEYTWASDRDYEDNLDVSNLNALGAEGWEVAGMFQSPDGETTDILMKRAKGWVPRDPEPAKTAAEEAAAVACESSWDKYSQSQLGEDGNLRPISRFDTYTSTVCTRDHVCGSCSPCNGWPRSTESVPDATGTCVAPSVEVPHVG